MSVALLVVVFYSRDFSMSRSDVHFYAYASDTSLLQLAIGMAGDLGLTRCPESPGPAYRSIVEDAANLRNEVQARNRHTNADRRAVLGVFYITSV